MKKCDWQRPRGLNSYVCIEQYLGHSPKGKSASHHVGYCRTEVIQTSSTIVPHSLGESLRRQLHSGLERSELHSLRLTILHFGFVGHRLARDVPNPTVGGWNRLNRRVRNFQEMVDGARNSTFRMTRAESPCALTVTGLRTRTANVWRVVTMMGDHCLRAQVATDRAEELWAAVARPPSTRIASSTPLDHSSANHMVRDLCRDAPVPIFTD